MLVLLSAPSSLLCGRGTARPTVTRRVGRPAMLGTEAEILEKMKEVQRELDLVRTVAAKQKEVNELKSKLSAASSELQSLEGSLPQDELPKVAPQQLTAHKPVTASIPAPPVDAAPAAPEQVTAAIHSPGTAAVRVSESMLQTAPEPVAAHVAAEPATTLKAAAVDHVRESVAASVPAPESVADAAHAVVSSPEAAATAASTASGDLATSAVSLAKAMATVAASAARAVVEAAAQTATMVAQVASKPEVGDAAAQATSDLGHAGSAVATQAGAALNAVQGAGLAPTQLAVSAVVAVLVGIGVATGADKFGSQTPAATPSSSPPPPPPPPESAPSLSTQQKTATREPWAGAALLSVAELTSIEEDALRLRKELAEAQAELATARAAKLEWLTKYEQSTTPAPAAAVAAPPPSLVSDAKAAVAAVMAQAGATAAGKPSWGPKSASAPDAAPTMAPVASSDTGQAPWLAKQEHSTQHSSAGKSDSLYNSAEEDEDDEAEIAAMMALARATVSKAEQA